MKTYLGEPDFDHAEVPAVGVLIANLGTPQAPSARALRPYLREFLSDPRVIELPGWFWKPLLEGVILRTRPAKSAAAYREVWTDDGSPLLIYTRKQAAGIESRLQERFATPLHVAFGMRYGEPSIESAVAELEAKGCRKLLFLPLYPQYAAATTASTFDALFASLSKRRWVPELRTIQHYADDPAWVKAVANTIRETWKKDGGEPERLLFSFHGIPLRYYTSGDPYPCQCRKSARLIVEELGADPAKTLVTFQSRFGKEPWVEPYTDETLKRLAAEGTKSVDVVCPGFSSDCLETIEEIDQENREYFEEGGGERYRYIPCLNDRPEHLDQLADLAARHLAGWAEEAFDEEAAKEERLDQVARAAALGCPAAKARLASHEGS